MTDQIMETLTNEEHERLLLMSEHAIAPPLSPAAQAVMKAAAAVYWDKEYWNEEYEVASPAVIAAAALRAAADQVVPVEHEIIDNCWYEKADLIREQFLAIAAELEAQ
jgi:hypothetical protein